MGEVTSLLRDKADGETAHCGRIQVLLPPPRGQELSTKGLPRGATA